MKKILLLLFLLFPVVSHSAVPVYHYAGWCDYCMFFDHSKNAEEARILQGDVKNTSFNIGINTIVGVYLLGYDLIRYGGISNIKTYTDYKLQF